jgi:O-antigen/teichoic acid export membrane protein
MLPAMSQQGHTPGSLARYFENTMMYLIMFALPLSLGLSLLGGRITLLLYGQAYEPAGPALQIYAWMLVAAAINHGISTTLVAVGQEKTWMVITGWGTAFNLITNVAAIPLLGHVGASMTTLASQIFVSALGFREVRRHLGELNLLAAVYKPVLAGMAMACVILGSWGQSLPFLVGCAGLCYVGGLFLFRALRREDLTLPIRSVLMAFRGQ